MESPQQGAEINFDPKNDNICLSRTALDVSHVQCLYVEAVIAMNYSDKWLFCSLGNRPHASPEQLNLVVRWRWFMFQAKALKWKKLALKWAE